MPYGRPPNLTLTNWDLGGEPSAWAYLQAGELFPATEIPAPSQPILERRGVLDLAQPVEEVIGELAGSGWAGVPQQVNLTPTRSSLPFPHTASLGRCTSTRASIPSCCRGW
jgi:hypothetical protein